MHELIVINYYAERNDDDVVIFSLIPGEKAKIRIFDVGVNPPVNFVTNTRNGGKAFSKEELCKIFDPKSVFAIMLIGSK